MYDYKYDSRENLNVRFKNVKGHKSPNKAIDITSQALYFKESNHLNKVITKEFSKFYALTMNI